MPRRKKCVKWFARPQRLSAEVISLKLKGNRDRRGVCTAFAEICSPLSTFNFQLVALANAEAEEFRFLRERERRERRPMQDFHGDGESDTGGKHLPPLGCAAGQSATRALQRRGDLFPDSGKRSRSGCFRGAAVPSSGGQPLARTPADDRRVQACVGVAHYRGASVLLLCAAGPERQAASSDLREAGGGLAGNCGCESRTDVGFACSADSGLFRRARGSLVWFAGAGGTLPAHETAESDGGLSGCGRRGARSLFREEAGCAAGDRG